MSVIKPNLGPHSNQSVNHLTFQQAFEQAQSNSEQVYYTTGNQTAFIVEATHGQKGEHANEPVLKFISDNTERARAYECCWGYHTNCINQHINIYTEAMK